MGPRSYHGNQDEPATQVNGYERCLIQLLLQPIILVFELGVTPPGLFKISQHCQQQKPAKQLTSCIVTTWKGWTLIVKHWCQPLQSFDHASCGLLQLLHHLRHLGVKQVGQRGFSLLSLELAPFLTLKTVGKGKCPNWCFFWSLMNPLSFHVAVISWKRGKRYQSLQLIASM